MLGHLGAGSDAGLHPDGGIELGFELFILLLKSYSIVTIVVVLEWNRLHPESLDKKERTTWLCV